jgi:small-conductance mechanosensitive channel
MSWLLTAGILVGYLLLTGFVGQSLSNFGRQREAATQRTRYIIKVFDLALTVGAGLALLVVWGIDYSRALLFGSSIIAILGVALFAQWSILSNVTASIVIFFNYPTRIGDRIRIQDGDNSIVGEIVDINLFKVLLKDDQDNEVVYPNNLLIQKPVIRLKSPESSQS